MSESILYPFQLPVLLVSEASPDIVGKRYAQDIATSHGARTPEHYYPKLKVYDAAGALYVLKTFSVNQSPQTPGFFQKLLNNKKTESLHLQLGETGKYELTTLKELLVQRLRRDMTHWSTAFGWDVEKEIQNVRVAANFEELVALFEA